MKRRIRGDGAEEQGGAVGLLHLRFYHSKALRTKTLAVLGALESAEAATAQSDALAEVVLELTEAGLAYYFVKPVQAANPRNPLDFHKAMGNQQNCMRGLQLPHCCRLMTVDGRLSLADDCGLGAAHSWSTRWQT